MRKNKNVFWPYLRSYFTVYLPKQRNSSPHTIAACKDTWNLMLRYLSVEKGIGMAGISMDDITAAAVTGSLQQGTTG